MLLFLFVCLFFFLLFVLFFSDHIFVLSDQKSAQDTCPFKGEKLFEVNNRTLCKYPIHIERLTELVLFSSMVIVKQVQEEV